MPRAYFGLILSLILFILLTWELTRRARTAWIKRDVFLFAVLLWSAAVFAITEGLSLFGQFRRWPVMTAWIALLALQAGAYLYLLARRKALNLARLVAFCRERLRFPKLSAWGFACLLIISLQLITLFWVAFVYPPTNYDSMTYHLPRIMHWEQNGSTAFYATSIERQNEYQPFAEYVLAHLYLLANKDRWLNLLQWFALILCAVGVSAIARKLGAGNAQQWTAALLCVSIPMAVLQASSTQNDLVLSALLLVFINFGLKLTQEAEGAFAAVGCGLALGLAILTKATAYIWAFPFCLYLGGWLILKLQRRGLALGGIIIALVLLTNGGFYARNASLHGSPLGSEANLAQAKNQVINLQALTANLIRNTALNLPIQTRIELIDNTAKEIASWLRLFYETTGFSITDARISYDGRDAFTLPFNPHEDFTSNPLHLLLIAAALLVALFTLGDPPSRKISLVYVLPLLLGFVLFSGTLKWQVWGTRLQLPFFAAWCAVIPIYLFSSKRGWLLVVPVIVGVFAFTWTFDNATRPINQGALYAQPREENYFLTRVDIRPAYLGAIQQLTASGCREIGLAFGENSFEYPLWAILKERAYPARIEHVRVLSASTRLEAPDFTPCAILLHGREREDFGDAFRVLELPPFTLYLEK